MQHDQKQLFQIACDYPFYLFTAEEISVLCRVGEHKVRIARNAKDSPFRFGLCRPEWLTAWMRAHPEYRDLKSVPEDIPPSPEDRAAAVRKAVPIKPQVIPIRKKKALKKGRKRLSSHFLSNIK